MDGYDLFKKLGVGVKFNVQRFQKDAELFKLTRPATQQQNQNEKTQISTLKRKVSQQRDQSRKKFKEEESEDSRSEEDESHSEEDFASNNSPNSDEEAEAELQLLGNIKSQNGKITHQPDRHKKKAAKDLSLEKRAQIQTEQLNYVKNKKRIHTHGTDIPRLLETFDQLAHEYNVHPQIISNIKAAGYDLPTPIQMQAIPTMLHRRELMACAPTGSGKTAAFIIPILHHLKEPRNQGFRALVLAPTRELAKQTYREFQKLSEGRGFRIHYIEKASTAIKKFGPKSSQKFDILVSTPNRLVYMLKQECLRLHSVEWLVVDESDKLFEEGKTGFRDQLAEIYKACDGKSLRRAMFSATFAFDVEEWCKLNLDNVIQAYVGARNSATETIQQELKFVGTESGKLFAIREIIQKGIEPPVLVFVQSKDRAKQLLKELIYDGINVDAIHSDRTQLQRDNVVKSFRAGKIWIMISTELMGRGIDFKGVNLVINYDFPNSAISYIHRIGRTGRAGRPGRAMTFFTEDDVVNIRSIANIMHEAGCPVPDYMLQIKRLSKKKRKKMSKKVPRRDCISTNLKAKRLQAAINEREQTKTADRKSKKRKSSTDTSSMKDTPYKKQNPSQESHTDSSSDMSRKAKKDRSKVRTKTKKQKKTVKLM
ncbi:probable ATP-dependent RNA helicase DDX52 [Mizuhopecten yessoensis]|uniref:Probable ATP-dependent RNA helicase DDX52 n=1 Tax=Mizuhopecten yessoensis TaxID=6573 RepID=A0A210PMN9_MIZYE|nr:probable ATP-dependent RNA helicase DDX52 [Mizuhopecten yessoensis]OWF37737.1 ATP-dependent RNA helicase DDX52 [Mizuhopecten yessoensis]